MDEKKKLKVLTLDMPGPGAKPKAAPPEISKMLTISTAHISPETAARMDDPGDMHMQQAAIYKKAGWGWYVYVTDRPYVHLPGDLKQCMERAASLGCQVLCLDSAGPVDPELPEYDWDRYEHKAKDSTRHGDTFMVIATEVDGDESYGVALELEPLETGPHFDVEAAVMGACTEYVSATPEGKEFYEHNGRCFNWEDFAGLVPDSICRRHGFTRKPTSLSGIAVDLGQHLVNDHRLQEQEQQ